MIKSKLTWILVGWLISHGASSCHLGIPKDKRLCFRSLKGFCEKNWQFDSKNLLVPTKQTYDFAFGRLPESECIKGLTMSEVNKIFGAPYEIDSSRNVWSYYVAVGEIETCKPSCVFFDFNFSKTNTLKSISQGSGMTEH